MEKLIDTSSVAVLVFDARTGVLTSHNREATRMAGEVAPTAETMEEVLAAVSIRRADGTEIRAAEIPLQQVMTDGDRVRVVALSAH